MIKEGIIPPFREEGFDPNDKSTYFSEEEYIKKIGVNQEHNNYLLPSDVYSSIFDQRISTLSFKAAIEINSEFFEDKTVLVINNGIGLYSLLCARVGAKKVYSLEPDKTNYKFQKKIVELNRYQKIIEVYNCDVEDIYNIEKVDIIVCEWMGNFLLSNSFLKKVIYARNKFLARDGIIFPDKATLYLCGIQDEEFKKSKFQMWDNVYNVNMSFVKNVSFKEPLIDSFNKNNIISNIYPIFEINMYKIKENDLNFMTKFELTFNQSDSLSALAGWFDVQFLKVPNTIKFTTSPFNQYTKWKQTIFYLENDIKVMKGDIMEGDISLKVESESTNVGDIEIKINYEIKNKNANMIVQSEEESENKSINDQENIKGTQIYKLSY
jgi:protein arginine N-methyltransferase 1